MIDTHAVVQGSSALIVPICPDPRFEVLVGGLARARSRKPNAPETRRARTAWETCTFKAPLVAFGVGLLFAAVLAAGLGAIGGARGAYEAAKTRFPRHAEYVEQGDSLWSIAREHPIEGLGASEVSDIIRSWNNLDSAMIHPGARLIVPGGPNARALDRNVGAS